MTETGYLFVPEGKARNRKLGQMASIYAPKATCPPQCPLMAVCYARHGLCAMVAARYATQCFGEVLDGITSVHEGLPWRWGTLGDLPGVGDAIDESKLRAIIARNEHRLGYAYTHKPLTPRNLSLIQLANMQGFTINVSVESLSQVDAMNVLGLPCTVVVSSHMGSWRKIKTEAGSLILRCPAEYSKIQCITCGGSQGPLCSRRNRKYAIGLTSHGSCRQRLDRMLEA
jgi:hypothetical protein